MSKIDFKKTLKHLYNPQKIEFTIVDVPTMNFLMIDGKGDPNNNPAFQESMNALYTMAFSIKFALKPQGVDYVVPPLEGLWWMENMEKFSLDNKDEWLCTVMIMQPDWVTPEVVAKVRMKVAKQKALPALTDLRFENYSEGLSVQTMYIGPFADEGPTITRMHEYIDVQGYESNGKHHEIYLSDPRRTEPKKMRTVLRQPIKVIS